MGDYFKPLRRKLGVATLAIACVLMGGWVRSLETADHFCRLKRKSYTELVSTGGVIVWRELTLMKKETETSLGHPPNGYSQSKSWGVQVFPDNTEHKGWDKESDFQLAGFIFLTATAKWNDIQMAIWVIPYWSIVIPLTLISFWLLLSKPRKSTSKKITEPIPTEGT